MVLIKKGSAKGIEFAAHRNALAQYPNVVGKFIPLPVRADVSDASYKKIMTALNIDSELLQTTYEQYSNDFNSSSVRSSTNRGDTRASLLQLFTKYSMAINRMGQTGIFNQEELIRARDIRNRVAHYIIKAGIQLPE